MLSEEWNRTVFKSDFNVSWSVCSTCGIFAAIYKVNSSVSVYLVDTVDWSFSHLEILIGFSFFLFFTFVLLLFGQNCSCLQLYACLNPESQQLVVIPPPPTICSQNMQIFAFFFPNVFPKVLAVRRQKGKCILTATHQKLCAFLLFSEKQGWGSSSETSRSSVRPVVGGAEGGSWM